MTVCLNSSGHMTKMSVIPIYGKFLKKNPYPKSLMILKLICCIWDSDTTCTVSGCSNHGLFTRASCLQPHGPLVLKWKISLKAELIQTDFHLWGHSREGKIHCPVTNAVCFFSRWQMMEAPCHPWMETCRCSAWTNQS